MRFWDVLFWIGVGFAIVGCVLSLVGINGVRLTATGVTMAVIALYSLTPGR